MRRTIGRTAAALGMTLAVVTPAFGITFGQLDTANTYSNVGALIGTFEEDEFLFCSGTLIRDGDGGWSDLFLTAAHCGDGDGRMSVTFDPTTDFDPDTEAFVVGDSIVYEGDFIGHPSAWCCGLNEPFDIAVVVLDQEVVGITPAPIATLNQLSALSNTQLRAATFITAGYGVVRNDKTGGFAPLSFDGDRRWVTQSAMSLVPAWLNLSQQPSTGDGGTCYGDSGGPHFLNGVVVSLTSLGDIPCRATDKTYRIDTPVSQAFLAQFLDD